MDLPAETEITRSRGSSSCSLAGCVSHGITSTGQRDMQRDMQRAAVQHSWFVLQAADRHQKKSSAGPTVLLGSNAVRLTCTSQTQQRCQFDEKVGQLLRGRKQTLPGMLVSA